MDAPPTTMYLWLISLTASKELSILLLKLLECKSNRYSGHFPFLPLLCGDTTYLSILSCCTVDLNGFVYAIIIFVDS